MLSNEPFTISVTEGHWPNRIYFDILPGSVLFHEGTKEEYVDWLYTAVQENEQVASEVSAIIAAIEDKSKMVRLVVPNRLNDFRGDAVLQLIKQVMESQ